MQPAATHITIKYHQNRRHWHLHRIYSVIFMRWGQTNGSFSRAQLTMSPMSTLLLHSSIPDSKSHIHCRQQFCTVCHIGYQSELSIFENKYFNEGLTLKKEVRAINNKMNVEQPRSKVKKKLTTRSSDYHITLQLNYIIIHILHEAEEL